MQILRLHQENSTLHSETLGVRPSNLCFPKSSKGVWHTQFESSSKKCSCGLEPLTCGPVTGPRDGESCGSPDGGAPSQVLLRAAQESPAPFPLGLEQKKGKRGQLAGKPGAAGNLAPHHWSNHHCGQNHRQQLKAPQRWRFHSSSPLKPFLSTRPH